MGVCIARVELGASFPAHMKRFVFHLYTLNLWFIATPSHDDGGPGSANTLVVYY